MFFLRKTSTIHIELLFRKSSWTVFFWFGLPGSLLILNVPYVGSVSYVGRLSFCNGWYAWRRPLSQAQKFLPDWLTEGGLYSGASPGLQLWIGDPARSPNTSEKINRESPRQTKPRGGPKRKVHEFRPFFLEFWCFSLGKEARFTLNFCSRMPLWKVHELTFLWFGLPGPLLN